MNSSKAPKDIKLFNKGNDDADHCIVMNKNGTARLSPQFLIQHT